MLFQLEHNQTELIRIDIEYSNSSLDSLLFETPEAALAYFQGFKTGFVRDFLLNVQQFKFITKLGSSSFIKNYRIEATFTQHLNLKLEADFAYFYD